MVQQTAGQQAKKTGGFFASACSLFVVFVVLHSLRMAICCAHFIVVDFVRFFASSSMNIVRRFVDQILIVCR
jgi:hypothetical protein